MAITAADIQNISFSIDRKGYDVDEVDVFLERVAEEVDAMNDAIASLQAQLANVEEPAAADEVVAVEETVAMPAPGVSAAQVAADEAAEEKIAAQAAQIAGLQAQIADLEAQLAEKAANDSAISQALIVAQRSADDILANAKAQAADIVKDADDEADRIVDKAEADRQRIIDAIRKLESDRADVRGEYRDMLADFVADAQRKLADIDADIRRQGSQGQARSEAHAGSYAAAPAAAAPASAYVAPVNPDPMVGGVPAETIASPAVHPQAAQSPSASGYVDKDFSGYGAADDGFDIDID